MVIRCERCSTLYELDETLLAPEGSSVQCTRCDHVFTARPPVPAEGAEPRAASAGLAVTSAELDSAVAAASGAPRDPPTPDAVAAGDVPPPSPLVESPGPRAPAFEPRYTRAGPPSVYRPTPGPTSARTPSVLRRNTVGAFESRLRWSARLRWLLPAGALGVVLLATGAFFLLRSRFASGGPGPHAEGAAVRRHADAGAPRAPLSARPPDASPAATAPAAAPAPVAPPPAASPGESPPGNVAPPPRKTVAQRPPAAQPSQVSPGSPVGASATEPPAAADAGIAPATPPSGGTPATARRTAPSALTPASIPDAAPASGMPQIAPPEATEGARSPAREPAVHDDAIGGG